MASKPAATRRVHGGEHVKLNNAPVLLYLYRGDQPDVNAPWVDERCGTYAGWNAHKYLGEKPCPPCQAAQAQYVREWRLRTGRVKTIRVRPSAGQLALLSAGVGPRGGRRGE